MQILLLLGCKSSLHSLVHLLFGALRRALLWVCAECAVSLGRKLCAGAWCPAPRSVRRGSLEEAVLSPPWQGAGLAVDRYPRCLSLLESHAPDFTCSPHTRKWIPLFSRSPNGLRSPAFQEVTFFTTCNNGPLKAGNPTHVPSRAF